MKKKYEVVVIGGGISGLSLAYYLAQMDREVLVIEKEGSIGGAIESLHYEDYTVDVGSHTCYNSYETLLEYVSDNPLKNKLIARSKQKYYFHSSKGFQGLTSPLNFPLFFSNIYKVFKTKKAGKSVEEYYSKILGKRNYQNFARHCFKAILSQDSRNYPAAFFLKKRKGRNKSYPRSFTFTEGLSALLGDMERHPKVTISRNTTVQQIERTEEGFMLTSSDAVFECEKLAFATYAQEVAKMTKILAPKLSSILMRISYTPVSSFGIVVNKEKVADTIPFAGLFTTSDDFTAIVSRDVAPHTSYRGFTMHAQGKVEKEVLRTRICKTLHINPEYILDERYKNTYLPQLQKGHEDFIEELQEEIVASENIFVTGNYFDGMSLEDCMRRSQQEAIRLVSTL